MAADRETIDAILTAVPQRAPFRFIDDILELDERRITGRYRFREDEYFYRGHFPGRPVTPGVILIEAMAQTGVVAFGLYLSLLKNALSPERMKGLTTLFTLADNVEFFSTVAPGETVIIQGEKVYFRGTNIKASVIMTRENGAVVCSGALAGMGVYGEKKS
ncbi:MAG: beta-hydroxyacyl-ACP dehydratase [Syntrophus sp. (in: bacteria)]|nr:beta-hydroxyacyl-ACP dehydratase [Syntrophus sp. (in: bacteria)]